MAERVVALWSSSSCTGLLGLDFGDLGFRLLVESIVGDSVMRVYGISGGRHRIMASDVKASSPISSPDCLKFHSPSFKHYLFQATRQSHNRDESETSFCVHWTYTGDPRPNILKPTIRGLDN